MGLDAANARIYGSEDDAVSIGEVGANLPEDLDAPTAHEHAGWLGDDGIDLNPSDSVETFTGHQPGTVRKKMSSSETTFVFRMLETKKLSVDLQFDVKERKTTDGITRSTFASGRKVVARSFVIDVFDDDGLHRRFVIPRGEIGERSTLKLGKAAITVYEFTVTIIGDWFEITNDPAVAVDTDEDGTAPEGQ